MSNSLEESQIYHIFGFLVANAIFLGKDPGFQNSKVNVMKVFSLDIHLVAYIVYNKTHGIMEETYDVEFDESNGCQDEQDKSSDVRDAIKNMSIGDVRPREEDESRGPTISIRVNPSASTQNDQIEQVVNQAMKLLHKMLINWLHLLHHLRQLKSRLLNQDFIMVLL
jgi:preprotein translocase subunit SecF